MICDYLQAKTLVYLKNFVLKLLESPVHRPLPLHHLPGDRGRPYKKSARETWGIADEETLIFTLKENMIVTKTIKGYYRDL